MNVDYALIIPVNVLELLHSIRPPPPQSNCTLVVKAGVSCPGFGRQ